MISDADWWFSKDRVPDEELIPCLIWEFLSESQTVRQLVHDWQTWFERGEDPLLDRQVAERRVAMTNLLHNSAHEPELVRDVVETLWQAGRFDHSEVKSAIRFIIG
mgnify:CR=1 FL=1